MAVSWFFPPALLFFSLAIIMAVVAMCNYQVRPSLILLFSSLFAMVACALTSMLIVGGLFAATAGKVMLAVQGERAPQVAQLAVQGLKVEPHQEQGQRHGAAAVQAKTGTNFVARGGDPALPDIDSPNYRRPATLPRPQLTSVAAPSKAAPDVSVEAQLRRAAEQREAEKRYEDRRAYLDAEIDRTERMHRQMGYRGESVSEASARYLDNLREQSRNLKRP